MPASDLKFKLCKACGDPATRILNDGYYCDECYDELKNGIISNQNVSMFGGSPASPDDISPWQENAIRHMENGGNHD